MNRDLRLQKNGGGGYDVRSSVGDFVSGYDFIRVNVLSVSKYTYHCIYDSYLLPARLLTL